VIPFFSIGLRGEAIEGIMCEWLYHTMEGSAMPDDPTTDDELGMAWWNALTEQERTRWSRLAGTGRAKDAWELFKGHGVIAALCESITETYGEPLAEPKLVPAEYRGELARLSHAELADVAWLLAQQVHDLADDPDGDMIELRCAIEAVQDRRRSVAVTLRRR
jgi:hypothetical protein